MSDGDRITAIRPGEAVYTSSIVARRYGQDLPEPCRRTVVPKRPPTGGRKDAYAVWLVDSDFGTGGLGGGPARPNHAGRCRQTRPDRQPASRGPDRVVAR